jgi:hypothetical protein
MPGNSGPDRNPERQRCLAGTGVTAQHGELALPESAGQQAIQRGVPCRDDIRRRRWLLIGGQSVQHLREEFATGRHQRMAAREERRSSRANVVSSARALLLRTASAASRMSSIASASREGSRSAATSHPRTTALRRSASSPCVAIQRRVASARCASASLSLMSDSRGTRGSASRATIQQASTAVRSRAVSSVDACAINALRGGGTGGSSEAGRRTGKKYHAVPLGRAHQREPAASGGVG